MSQNKKYKFWFFVGVIAILLEAPNNIAIRHAVGTIDLLTFNMLRFGLIALVAAPYVFAKRRLFTKRAWQYSFLVGILMTTAVTTHVWAIQQSQASYVAILTLIAPIIFIFYSAKINREKINRRSFAGITLAAAGALTIVGLPVVLHQGSHFTFYPLATALVFIRSLSFPLAIILVKKAHDHGAPIMATMGVSSVIVFAISCALLPLSSQGMTLPVNPSVLFAIGYSALGVALLARMLTIASYERIGSVASAGLAYVEACLAVMLPVFVLQEKLSVEMIVGGVLILLGVYMVEHHKLAHHKHSHVFRHH